MKKKQIRAIKLGSLPNELTDIETDAVLVELTCDDGTVMRQWNRWSDLVNILGEERANILRGSIT